MKRDRREYMKKWHIEHKLHEDSYREKNKTHIKQIRKKYKEKNSSIIKQKNKIYKLKNMEKIKQYNKIKYKNNVIFKLSSNIRTRLSNAIRRQNSKKYAHSIDLVGCNIIFLKDYLEKQFKPGMKWKNYGEWHIDHIIPLNSFDLTKKSNQKKACHYTNLQPLWATENLSKGDKI